MWRDNPASNDEAIKAMWNRHQSRSRGRHILSQIGNLMLNLKADICKEKVLYLSKCHSWSHSSPNGYNPLTYPTMGGAVAYVTDELLVINDRTDVALLALGPRAMAWPAIYNLAAVARWVRAGFHRNSS